MSTATMEEAPPVEFAETDLVQSLCRESFFEFVKEFWEVLIPEEQIGRAHV